MREKEILRDYGDILLPKDVQQILQVGRNTVYKLLEDGTIKSIKIGNSYRIPKLNLAEFMYPDETTKEVT
jgi:excisionase family DNA binding protein